MSTNLRKVIDYDRRRRDMLASPDLTGDLLLIALAIDEVNYRKDEDGRSHKRMHWVKEVALLIYGEDARNGAWRVKDHIGKDCPRYELAGLRGARACPAPMVRREGVCGKGGTYGGVDRDPVTGEGAYTYYCNRHRHLAAGADRRHREWVANGKPVPPANTGGVLRRWYGGNWDEIYRWASGRDPMPGGREATPPRPTLRLIQGGAEEVES